MSKQQIMILALWSFPLAVFAQSEVEESYRALVNLYRSGQLPASDLGKLALQAKEIGERKLADSIARDYCADYLDGQPDSVLLSRENLQFISGFSQLISVGDRYFADFRNHGAELEKQMGWMDGYTHQVVVWKITGKYIDSRLYKDGKPLVVRPKWKKYARQITRAYDKSYADDILVPAQKRFYEASKNWRAYIAIFETQLQQHPLKMGQHFLGGMVDDVWQVNGVAWMLFLQCDDTLVLKKGLDWSKLTVRLAKEANFGACDQYLDTEANLLYKLGQASKAILLEQEALDLTKGKVKDYIETLTKMRAGEQTWPKE